MNHTSTSRLLAGSTSIVSPRGVFGRVRADASAEPKAILAQLAKDFADYRTANDEKLSAKADVLLDEKVTRIDASVASLQTAIDEMNVRAAAARVGAGQKEQSPEDRAYASNFAAFFRNGDKEGELRAASRTGVRAALSEGVNTAGGYFAPVEWDRTITGALKLVSPIRQIATVQPTTKTGFSKVYNDRTIGSGWVGETAARPQTTTPGLTLLTFSSGELYANPAATQDLLEDSEIDVQKWLADEVEAEFARQEGVAFLSGDGVNKPKGLLVDASHPWGAVQSIPSAAVAKLSTDDVVDLIYGLPSSYTANARFVMNRNTQSAVRVLKDGQGRYIWQPTFAAGEPATLAGYPITEAPDMPNVAAGAIPIVFGDFARGYLIIDRLGTTVLRDPFSNKPYVMFYTRKRVGGGVNDPNALRYLTIKSA